MDMLTSQNFNGGGEAKNIGGLIGKIKPNGVLKKAFQRRCFWCFTSWRNSWY